MSQSRRTQKYQPYGKLHHDLFPHIKELHEILDTFLEKYDSKIPTEVHNAVLDLRSFLVRHVSILYGELAILARHNTKIRLSEERDWSKKKTFLHENPCGICGYSRVHNFAHIIPAEEGGESFEDNLLNLCANCHHLFDRRQLTEQEWQRIDFTKKSPAAQKYAREVILPTLKRFWGLNGKTQK